MNRILAMFSLTTACTLGAAAAAGLFATGGSIAQGSPQVAQSVDAAIAANFAAFRRARVPGDSAPLGGRMDAVNADEHGANRALSRRTAAGADGVDYFLTPARDGVCLSSSDYVLNACLGMSDALSPRVFGIDICDPLVGPDSVEVSGLLPDAAGTSVGVSWTDGRQTTLAVPGNVVVIKTARSGPLPTALTYTDGGGPHTVPIDHPADPASDSCDRSVTPAQARAGVAATNAASGQ